MLIVSSNCEQFLIFAQVARNCRWWKLDAVCCDSSLLNPITSMACYVAECARSAARLAAIDFQSLSLSLSLSPFLRVRAQFPIQS